MTDFVTEHFYYSSADDERYYFMGNVSELFIPPPVKPLLSGKYRVIDGQLCYIEPILPEDAMCSNLNVMSNKKGDCNERN
jgi:hypothetical protein